MCDFVGVLLERCTEPEACLFMVEISLNNDTPVEMRNLRDNDIIDGCADELARVTKQAGLSR